MGFGVRVVFFLFLLVWGIRFMVAPIQGDYVGRSFMHLINLPFHEAGHIIFSFLGDFMGVVGGTLMQVLIPCLCTVAFLRRQDVFGASFGVWWTGQSLIDAAAYIYDARAGKLMLLGGVTGQEAPEYHDWHNILGRLGLLEYDHVLAYLAKGAGVLIMILALLWGGYTLISLYRGRSFTGRLE